MMKKNKYGKIEYIIKNSVGALSVREQTIIYLVLQVIERERERESDYENSEGQAIYDGKTE